jgi:hypothetical protein
MKEGILRHLIQRLFDISASRGVWVDTSVKNPNIKQQAEQLEFNLARRGNRNRSLHVEAGRHRKVILALLLLGMATIYF